MFENNSKFPRIFIYILITLAVLITIGIFFSFKLVEIFYFVALIVMVVFAILDKIYGESLTNHKAVFFLFDFINLIATISILYYEYSKHNAILNGFLISLICILSALLIIDFIFISDKYIFKREFLANDIFEFCSMVCIFSYFNKVSEFWFAIVACVFFILSLSMKVIITIKLKLKKKVIKNIEENKDASQSLNIEKIIQSEDDQGELE